MQWHILGAGSIGCIWASAFIQKGYKTRLILKSEDKLRLFEKKPYIRYEHAVIDDACNNGKNHQPKEPQQIPALAELPDSNTPISHLLITTKAFAAFDAFQSIVTRLTPNAIVILLHNGMGPQYKIAQTYPNLNLYVATTTDGGYLREPFHCVRAGQGITYYGRLNATKEHSAYSLPFSLPSGLQLKTQQVDNIEQRLWHKLAINAAINPVTALYQCKNGELFDNSERAALVRTICEEVSAVALASNQSLLADDLIKDVENVCKTTAANYSSMLQDCQHKRRTEINEITGFIYLKAQELGIHTPINQDLLQRINNQSLFS